MKCGAQMFHVVSQLIEQVSVGSESLVDAR